MQNSRSGQAKAVLTEVTTRHDDIKRIQKTIFVCFHYTKHSIYINTILL